MYVVVIVGKNFAREISTSDYDYACLLYYFAKNAGLDVELYNSLLKEEHEK